MDKTALCLRRTAVALAPVLFFISACGNKFAYKGSEQISDKKQSLVVQSSDKSADASSNKIGGETVGQPLQLPTQPAEPAKKTETYIDAKETFQIVASDPPPTDFVFVVDSSGSMAPLIERFITGFERISSSIYPPSSRMAVMNMIASEPTNLNIPLAEQVIIRNSLVSDVFRPKLMSLIGAEPGYLRFVQRQGIQNFKNTVNQNALSQATWNDVKWGDMLGTHEVCETEWFKPEDKNQSQTSCLRAAMQITGVVGVESGLLAILQLMQKNIGKPLFRENASVHFILISDTHDPGHVDFMTPQYREKIRPKYPQIKSAVHTNTAGLKQVKIHGVIPKEQACTADEARIDETSYIPEINASGGVWVDSCDSTLNYESVVSQIFNEAKKHPPFILKADTIKNVSVKVNGVASSDFRIIGSNSVEVNGLSNTTAYTIEISYSKPE